MMNDSDIIANKSDMKPIIIGEKTAADSAYEYLFEGAPSIEAQRAAKLFDLEFSNLQDVMCCICADPVPFGEGTTIPGCQHSMCLDCVAKAIVQDQRQCPAKDDGDGNRNCSSMIPTILLRHVLPVADFETIQRNKINVLDDQELVFNTSRFECPICLGRIEPGDGVVLRDCIHEFCLDCLRQTVDHCRDAQVSCPFADHEYSCKAVLQQREVRGVLGDQMAYDRLISQCLRVAEGKLANTFHCLTADCSGFCVLEDDQDMFWCEVCDAKNCLICQAIHDQVTCQQYHDWQSVRDGTNVQEYTSRVHLENLVKSREAMVCQYCKVVIIKISGCDHLVCGMCKQHLSWTDRGKL